MAASYKGAADVVKHLINAGTRTDPIDRMKKPAVVYAAGQGQAAGQGHIEAVKLLHARGAQAALRDDRGLTARDSARQASHAEIMALLPTNPRSTFRHRPARASARVWLR